MRGGAPKGSELIYNPRSNPAVELRSTYTAKSPFRENFKKDLLLKNHQKCIEIMSLAISLAGYELTEPLALAFLILRNVEKELASILDSLRKEQEGREDPMMRSFVTCVEGEIG